MAVKGLKLNITSKSFGGGSSIPKMDFGGSKLGIQPAKIKSSSLLDTTDTLVSKGDVASHENMKQETNKIKLDSSLMMEMKYPSLSEFIKNNFEFNEENVMDQSFDMIASCIDKIYNEEEVWAAADCTKKEITSFLESMNTTQFKEIEKFFETMPKLSHKLKVTNPKTGVESEVLLEGLASFFS